MRLLAIETSSNICGACILENEKIIDKIELDNGLTHSESLMPLIQNILKKNNYKISDFDAFVCDIGPGSFTGIRIGVATVKAFVDSMENLKYTGVSSLEALVYNITYNGLICSVIDANNNNCYFSLYNLEEQEYTQIIPPTAASIDEMLQNLNLYQDKQITFVGNGAITYKDEIKLNIPHTKFLDDRLNTLNTDNLALAGYKKILAKKTIDLCPMYLKKPQAQRQLEEKLKKD